MSTQAYREGHCTAEVTNFDFYVTTSRDGREFRKFGLVMRIIEDGHPDNGRSITFESLVDSEGAKKRVMTALKNIGYVVPLPPADASPLLQRPKLIGRKCRPKIACRDGKYWEASFVDPFDDNRSDRPVEWKKPLSEDAKADFMESFNAFARSTLDQSSEPAPQTQRQAAPQRQPQGTARPAAAPATRQAAAPASASRQAAPQRQPRRDNPDLGDNNAMGTDEDVPF